SRVQGIDAGYAWLNGSGSTSRYQAARIPQDGREKTRYLLRYPGSDPPRSVIDTGRGRNGICRVRVDIAIDADTLFRTCCGIKAVLLRIQARILDRIACAGQPTRTEVGGGIVADPTGSHGASATRENGTGIGCIVMRYGCEHGGIGRFLRRSLHISHVA